MDIQTKLQHRRDLPLSVLVEKFRILLWNWYFKIRFVIFIVEHILFFTNKIPLFTFSEVKVCFLLTEDSWVFCAVEDNDVLCASTYFKTCNDIQLSFHRYYDA